MKKIVFLLAILGIVSCTGRPTTGNAPTDQVRLEKALAEKDSLLNDLIASLNDISENLTQIKDREGIVTAAISPEISREQRAQIGEDIAAIDQLLEQNRHSLQRLNNTTEQLRKANIHMGELETLVSNFAKQIQDKDKDIAVLRTELSGMQDLLAELNTEVETLSTGITELTVEKQSLKAVVSDQEEALNTVYYIVGSERLLREESIIDKSGFIGRTVTMNNHYELDKFTRIDRRELDRIAVGQRRATIVTPHPSGSYRLVMSGKHLLQEIIIVDPDRFWESSKVLVVSYK